jgi:phosphoenolpyruvate-protein kinase (PTS system EI component)
MLAGLAASSGIARGAAFVCSCGESLSVPRRPVAPAEVPAELDRVAIAGIVAEQGGPTAHAVIIARALGIPTLLLAPRQL